MRVISATSLRGKNIIREYSTCAYTRLEDVYGRYSREKYLAFQNCEIKMREEGGLRLRIIAHNTFTFTVAWIDKDANIRVETSNNSYIVAYPQL